MSDLDLASLRAVAVLAETLSFRAAAKRLAMTQPALSLRLKRLEDQLGLRLFERSRAGVALSEAGRLFLPHAQRVLGEATAAERAARRIAHGEEGSLRLGYTPVSFFTALPERIRAFGTARPDVTIALEEMLSDEVEAALVADVIDVGVLHPPVAAGGLELMGLPNERYAIVVPEDDPLAARASTPLAALAGRDLVLTARSVGPAVFARIESLCHASGFAPRVRQEAPNSLAVLGLVAAGYGAGLVIGALALSGRAGLSFVAIEGTAPELPFAIAVPAGRPRTAVVEGFVGHLHAAFEDQRATEALP